MAESCPAEEFAKFRKRYPDHTVVSYVNTSAEVKALTDVCCTSTNALKIVESIPAGQPIIFGPDRNLGGYIRKVTGRENMILWDGSCHVHEKFSLDRIRGLKATHPHAKTVVHPECPAEIVEEADYVGSTAGILDYCGQSEAKEFIVVTESGILVEMRKRYPEKVFIPAPSVHEAACNECNYMKMITLESILECLESETPEVLIDESIREAAKRSIDNMISVR